MGGSNNERVPAWKLRQQERRQQQQRQTKNGQRNGDELGGPMRPRGGGDLDSKPNGTTTSRVPAWKLREQMKRRGGSTSSGSFDELSVASGNSRFSRGSASSTASSQRRAVSMVPDDPTLPPAFKAIRQLQERKRDDFNSLCSVHSRSVTSRSRANSSRANGSPRTATTSYVSTYGDHDAFEFLESDSDETSSFDEEGSFASLGSDADEDDEAYRQSKNQMARLTIETQNQSKDSKRVGTKPRFKKIGTPLDFIAEVTDADTPDDDDSFA